MTASRVQGTDITIGVVRPQYVDGAWHDCMMDLARTVPFRYCVQESGPMVDKARNAVVEAFLGTDSEYLMFIDTDMTFTPQMVVDLVSKAQEDRIISGFCLGRDGYPVARVRREGMWYPIKRPDGVSKVDITGAAFTICHRDIYSKMQPVFSVARPWYAFTERDEQIIGEDAEFCLRAAELGFLVLVDGTISPGHRKVAEVSEETM
jgi:hypothetical protein